MSDFSQSQNKIWYWFCFSQILNPKGIEIFWLLSRFLYILLLVWLFKFVSLNSWHSSLSIDFAFYIICFHSAGIYFLTMDVSDIQFCLHIRFCRFTTSDIFPWSPGNWHWFCWFDQKPTCWWLYYWLCWQFYHRTEWFENATQQN